MERKDPNYRARVTLISKNDQIMRDKSKWSEKNFKAYIDAIKTTYKPGQPYQYQLFPALSNLASWYIMKRDMKKHAEVMVEMFEAKRDCDFVFAATLIVEAVKNYLEAKMPVKAKETLEIAEKYFVGSIEHYNYAFGFDKLTKALVL